VLAAMKAAPDERKAVLFACARDVCALYRLKRLSHRQRNEAAGVAAAAPGNPALDAIGAPIDGVYLIGGRRIEVRDQTRRNVVSLADFHERPARRTALPSSANHADSARRTVDISTPNAPISSLVH
jgi:hypothetical protein